MVRQATLLYYFILRGLGKKLMILLGKSIFSSYSVPHSLFYAPYLQHFIIHLMAKTRT